MRTLIVSEFISLDGAFQGPGGKDKDRDGGFEYGGWTWPYLTHAVAFEPMPAGDPFGDLMNPAKEVRRVSHVERAHMAQHHNHSR
jgi:hypothetical protein